MGNDEEQVQKAQLEIAGQTPDVVDFIFLEEIVMVIPLASADNIDVQTTIR